MSTRMEFNLGHLCSVIVYASSKNKNPVQKIISCTLVSGVMEFACTTDFNGGLICESVGHLCEVCRCVLSWVPLVLCGYAAMHAGESWMHLAR